MKRYPSLLALTPVALLLGVSGVGAANTQNGQTLYAAKCAMCHAKDLEGNPAMAKMYKLDQSALNLLSKDTQGKKDADLIATTTKGKGKMPAQEGKLKPEEIADIIAYVRSMAAPAADKSK